MKKFLVFLLVAIIACKAVEEIQEEELIKGVMALYNKLVALGVINILKSILKKSGRSAAKSACCSYAPELCNYCGAVLGKL